MLASELLKKVRRYLLEFGWHQGEYAMYANKTGPVCAEGALRCVLSNSTSPYEVISDELDNVRLMAAQYLVRAASVLFPGGQFLTYVGAAPTKIPYINDYFCKSSAQAIKWFDLAIELAERDENGPNSNNLSEANHGVGREDNISSPSPVVVAV